MLRFVFRGKILPSADVVGPIGHPRGREVEPGRNLALQSVPGRVDIRRPNDGSVPLRAKISVARENQRTVINIAPEAVVDGSGMQQRIDVEVAASGSGKEIAAVRRKVRFGFIRPYRVETFADDVVAN